MAASSRFNRISLLQGILPLDRAQLPREIMAGLTLAALAIPEVMGYTRIAGMPVVTGLYTILIPMVLFALFGSSRHLVVGADSATAAMMATSLAGMAASGSPQYLTLAAVLALMVGAMLLIARLLNLGLLADFLSRTVLIGFLTGVGIQVALGQVTGMLGVSNGGQDTFYRLSVGWMQLQKINPYALGLSLAVLTVIVGARLLSRKIPGALIAVAGAITASWALDFQQHGVVVLGVIPQGLPALRLPNANLSWQQFQQLIPPAFAMFMVIIAQSAATSRAYAARYHEWVRDNVDLTALGLANLGAAVSGAFVVNGSPTKTQMVDSAGGRSQLAQLVTAVVVVLVLLLATGPLAYMPEAALSAVVFLIGVELIDIRGMRRILRERPWEFWVALITTVVVVFWGVEQGILLAIVLSLLVHTRHGYRPQNGVIIKTEDGRWRTVPVANREPLEAGLLVYRFSHSMYYANAEYLQHQVLDLVRTSQQPVRWFCIDFAAVDDVDFTAAETLRSLVGLLQQSAIRVVFTGVAEDVRTELDRSGISALIGTDAYFENVADMVDAYRQRTRT